MAHVMCIGAALCATLFGLIGYLPQSDRLPTVGFLS
jgi:hypothetical protein